ncbi:MAG: hypothetical protein Q9M40_12810 [Sulfurimonas sp.]|nr:hypothetical protein [Sulfurimonas sp.]
MKKLYFYIRRNAKITNEESLNKLRKLFSLDYYTLNEARESIYSFLDELKLYITELNLEEKNLDLFYALINEIKMITNEPENKNKYIQKCF